MKNKENRGRVNIDIDRELRRKFKLYCYKIDSDIRTELVRYMEKCVNDGEEKK